MVMRRNALIALLVTVAAPTQSFAQDAEATRASEDEIIVTAQKREENIQDVPIAITALSGDRLDRQLIRDVRDLQANVPGLLVSNSNGGLDVDFAVRGISTTVAGPGAGGAVAFHRDGVYQVTSAAAFGEFFDVERIEVLRGPQGTLFGRNSTAGAINIISRKAEAGFSIGGDVQIGNYALRRFRGFANAELTDGVYVRVAGQVGKRDGYLRNTAGFDLDDLDEYAIRPQIVIRPSDQFEIQLLGEFFRNRSRGVGTKPLITTAQLYAITAVIGPFSFPNFFNFAGAAPISTDPRTISLDVTSDTRARYDRDAVTAVVTGDLGGVDLKVTGGYVSNDQSRGFEADGTNAILIRAEQFFNAKQLSIEAQLASTRPGPFQWIAGVYYLNNDSTGYIPVSLLFQNPSGVPLTSAPLIGANVFPFLRGTGGNRFNQADLRSFAVYGQGSYEFSDQFKATLGLRWTEDKLNAVFSQVPYPVLGALPPTANAARFREVTGRAALEFRPVDDLLLYAQASRGFNVTGFNAVSGVGPVPIAPEIIWAYEGGLKSAFADGKIVLNLAGFYNDYQNLNQTQVVGATSVTDTGGARVIGVEAEAVLRPVDRLRINLSFAYLDATYQDFNFTNPLTGATVSLDGNRLVRAPRFSGSAGIEYGIALGSEWTLTPRVDVYAQDRVFYRADNNPALQGSSFTRTNATLSLRAPENRFSVEAFVENLENDTQITNLTASFPQLGGFPLATFSAPRTYGLRAGFRF
jgi:iron complex outermembrane recepter protein